jgi:hypothetical protein
MVEEKTKDEEIWELRRAFGILYTMITQGNNLFDISKAASRLAQRLEYPFVQEPLSDDAIDSDAEARTVGEEE